ncbi:MAG: hypothetical protein QW390_00805 [Candidatus Bathyarchaeia archaeon]
MKRRPILDYVLLGHVRAVIENVSDLVNYGFQPDALYVLRGFLLTIEVFYGPTLEIGLAHDRAGGPGM